uniref:Armadillo-type fold,Armadillo-like helical n=1 Tax=Rhabditophanes sp. KR3021 TaxID=114890 RepID=A0AC35TX64_9BILA
MDGKYTFEDLNKEVVKIIPEALVEFYKTLPADVFGGKSAEPKEFLQKTFDNYLESDDWEKRDSALEIFDALHSFFKVPDYESVKELIIKDPSEFVRASGVKFLTTSYPILFNSDIWHLMTPELDSIVRRSFLHALENLETPSTIYLQNESTLIYYLDDDDTFIHDKALSLLKRHCNFKSANPPNITTTDIFSLLTHQTESDETQVKECYGD